MKSKFLLAVPFIFGIASYATAAPEDMVVMTWDAGCEHTMTTNHFELAPGESVEIDLDLSSCPGASMGDLLFFGYRTTKNSSEMLTARDGVDLGIALTPSLTEPSADGAQEPVVETWSDTGSVLTQATSPATHYTLYAENINKKKAITIRLRSQLIATVE